MADPTLSTLDTKIFYDTAVLDNLVSRASEGGKYLNYSASQMAGNRSKQESSERTSAVDYLNQIGLGNIAVGDISANKNNADFLAKYPTLGKAYSYTDLAKQALSNDPSFDPTDMTQLNSFAQTLKDRGLTNKDSEDIKTLATTWSAKNALDRATNPAKYQTADQKAANLGKADQLVKTVYGQDYQDSEGLTQFLADRLAGGESAYELSQFLKTTPQYTQSQSDLQAKKASDEASAARESLNTELVKTQQDVFNKAQPDIIASYMRAGRLNSSGLNSALAKAQQQLESERQGYLANAAYTSAQQQAGYNREDFVNQQNQGFNQYLQNNQIAQQQKLNLQNIGNSLTYQQPFTNLSRYQQQADAAQQRQYELEDYSAQRNDFYDALSKQRQQQNQSAMYGLLGNILGGAAQGLAMCFDPNTIIEFRNGDKIKIGDVKLGDILKDSGIVTSVRDGITDDYFYDYKGVIVTEFHAVKEDGEWKRVGNSKYGKRMNPAGVVRTLGTSTHRLFIDGIEFADEFETSMGGNITLEDSLTRLNNGLK